MRIGIDLDEVLYPWYDQAHAACVAAGITNGVTPTSWAPYEDYGCDKADWLAALDDATLRTGGLYRAEPIDGAIHAMHTMKDAGHQLHIVTARGQFRYGGQIQALTIAWLRHWFVPHDSLTFSPDKTIVRSDVFIDDHVRNVRDLEAAGVRTWLMSTRCNQAETHPRRVSTLQEFAEAIAAETFRSGVAW